MSGFNFKSSDLTNPAWRTAAGLPNVATKKHRAKRFTGETSQHKAWVREMAAGAGRFIPTGRQPNWLNGSRHWTEKREIADVQKRTAELETLAMLNGTMPRQPVLVTLTRYGPNLMDKDGNAAALKYFQDGVAKALGIDDGDMARIDFDYAQVKTDKRGWYGVRIEISGGIR